MTTIVEQAREAFLEELDKATEQVLDNWREHVDTVGIEKKGGPGSGHRDHRGRPGKRGGSLPGTRGVVGALAKLNKVPIFSKVAPDEIESIFHVDRDTTHRAFDDFSELRRKASKEKSAIRTVALSDITFTEPGQEINRVNNLITDWEHSFRDVKGVRRLPRVVKVSEHDYRVYDGHHRLTAIKLFGATETRVRVIDLTHHYSVVEKQLPIDHDSKQALIQLRTQMFYDISDSLAEQMYTGDISIGQWQESMKQAIREVHSSNAAIGKGGWDLMEPADWGRLGPQMQSQYRYLQGFTEHVSENRETVSLKHIKARARLYGEGAAGSAVLMEAGVVFEALLPYLPKDGSTNCLNRCHCQWFHNITGTDGDFRIVDSTWVLGIADHCEMCLERDGHVETNRVHKVVDIPVSIGGY